MTKEQILSDISQLIQDIDKCTDDFVGAALENKLCSEPYKHFNNLTRLMVDTHQELTFLYDYIKEGGEQ